MKRKRLVVGKVTGTVKFDWNDLPEYKKDILARATLHAVERFFALPGVQEDYEKWLVEYEKKQAEKESKDSAENCNDNRGIELPEWGVTLPPANKKPQEALCGVKE